MCRRARRSVCQVDDPTTTTAPTTTTRFVSSNAASYRRTPRRLHAEQGRRRRHADATPPSPAAGPGLEGPDEGGSTFPVRRRARQPSRPVASALRRPSPGRRRPSVSGSSARSRFRRPGAPRLAWANGRGRARAASAWRDAAHARRGPGGWLRRRCRPQRAAGQRPASTGCRWRADTRRDSPTSRFRSLTTWPATTRRHCTPSAATVVDTIGADDSAHIVLMGLDAHPPLRRPVGIRTPSAEVPFGAPHARQPEHDHRPYPTRSFRIDAPTR